jgi:MFS family permease
VSLLGSGVAPVALAFAVLGLPGASATDLGLVLAARAVAQVLLLLLGGVLGDRWPRIAVLLTSDLLSMAAQGAVAALFLTGTAGVPAVAALAAVNGAAGALFLPAARGVVPEVVTGEHLLPANALLRLSANVTGIVGAALAGVLVVTVGAGWALAADAASFGVSALLLLGVRLPAGARTAATSVLTDLREGWREFASRRWLWVVVSQFALVNGCFAAVNVLGPLTAQRSLGGAAGWSAVLTCLSVGLVAGSLLALRLRPRFPLRTAVAATLGFAPPFVLLAVPAPVWLIGAAMLATGVCVDVFEVLWDTTLQQHVPHTALSRIGAYDAVGSFALGPVCLAVVGPLADSVGTRAVLLAGGAVSAAAGLAALADRTVRRLPPTAVSSAAGEVSPGRS